MAKKPTLNTVASGFQSTVQINENLTKLADALDNTISRDGSTPNTMSAPLDLNTNDLLNGGNATFSNVVVAGVDMGTKASEAAASAAAAATSESNAATSASNASTDASSASIDAALSTTNATTTTGDVVLTSADVVLTHADVVLTHADELLTRADTILTAADVVLTAADVIAAEADKVQTGLDRTAVAADLVQTNLDQIATSADVLLTNADVVLAEADKVQTGLDRIQVAADLVLTDADQQATASDRALVAADLVATNQDTIDTAADLVATNQDTIDTAADVALTAADRVQTGLDRTASSNSQVAAASSAASAASVYDTFDDRYLGAKAVAPTLDNDGAALVVGALYFDSALGAMYIWDGGSWIAASSAGGASLNNFYFTATAAQTTFTGVSDGGGTLSYIQSNLMVILNGIILEDGTDYTATTGTSIVLTVAAALNDELNILAFKTFQTADMVSASTGGTFTGNVDFNNGIDVVGNATVTGTVDGRDVAVDGATLDALASDIDLAAIAASKAITAVDGFVYDTSLDSDGGAWRLRCNHTSWYNETLNTATRGATREFPAVAVIIAEAATVTIYDATDSAMPMWMVFGDVGMGSGQTCSAISAVNGTLIWGATHASDTNQTGLVQILFIEDDMQQNGYYGNLYAIQGTIASGRSAFVDGPVLSATSILNTYVNDVAMTVLPDAPIDAATGLPIPTIAVATDGGVSVITDGGDVWDITQSTSYNIVSNIAFTEGNKIAYSTDSSAANRCVRVDLIPTADFVSTTSQLQKQNSEEFYTGADFGYAAGDLGLLLTSGKTILCLEDGGSGVRNIGSNEGLTQVHLPDTTTPAEGMVAFVTSDYTTGMMKGDIQRSWLSYTSNSAVEAVKDRSVNASPLVATGTMTHTAVATGSELYASSGFSASNYYEEAYSADLDFGTGDFSVMGWVKFSAFSGDQYFMERGAVGDAGNIVALKVTSTGLTLGQVAGVNVGTTVMPTNTRTFVALTRVSGVAYMYVNGLLDTSSAAATTVTKSAAILRLGNRSYNTTQPATNGSLALLRISATAPTAADVATIYEYEKGLFQENALATLPADAVTALAYDEVTKRLRIGTASGMAQMQEGSLRVTERDAVGVTTFISSTDELEIKQ